MEIDRLGSCWTAAVMACLGPRAGSPSKELVIRRSPETLAISGKSARPQSRRDARRISRATPGQKTSEFALLQSDPALERTGSGNAHHSLEQPDVGVWWTVGQFPHPVPTSRLCTVLFTATPSRARVSTGVWRGR